MDPGTRESTSRSAVVAAFDVDKTLTNRDCVVPFLLRVGGASFVARLVVRSPQVLVAAIRRNRDRVKALATRSALRGRPVSDVDTLAREFADRVWERHMRADTVARLGWHLEQGHRVVLVSASYRNYLVPLAERLGAHAVISTELDVENGRCTGELRGPNCRADVKAERLRTWIDEQGWESAEVHAYGDSAGDRAMLDLADHATLVGADLLDVTPRTITTGSVP